ncbi:carbohydrate kinase family protein [Agromyces protaetiae]|uniref:Carbohydrate kinase family protein n=1 Tax=Agromyces protaetiae TaxID=2509455 RepID=A0A4P6FBL9_9MICO|nr:PfkB family carbohydrate kinase [Agromyces protaetiae]QAY72323.1 carbohydrate kinase family protein [Agromyces protaetiae]
MPHFPSTVPHLVVCGPASWNHLIVLDRLPEPVPHMQFATGSVHTVGGTSAGKTLHLASLGAAGGFTSELHALVARDADGRRIVDALEGAGVDLHAHTSGETERHVNLMTEAGARVSLYVSTPTEPDAETLATVEAALARATIAVVDLSGFGAEVLARRASAGAAAWTAPVWADLHDYDGASAFHEPFVRAAEVVFMNDDGTDDPWALMASCLARGPRLAICTLGAEGAIALAADGRRFGTPAVPIGAVVDTNGAGDAFFAGFLAARLAGEEIDGCLAAGAAQAIVALASEHLHPALDRR